MNDFTKISNVGTYEKERLIITNANLDINNQDLSTEDLRNRATALMNRAKDSYKEARCCERLSYRLGYGQIKQLEYVAYDLKTIAKDIDSRKNDPAGEFLNTIVNGVVLGFMSSFSKFGPRNPYKGYYKSI